MNDKNPHDPMSPTPGERRADTLLITHTDRDGVFSGAAALRALGDPDGTDVLLTQGCYLAEELEDLASTGRRYRDIVACDTYWHPPGVARLIPALDRLLEPGGQVAWIDHHPSSIDFEDDLRRVLPLSPRSRLVGDRQGKLEAVSLVVGSFRMQDDPVARDLLKATARGWERNGEETPAGVRAWMRVVDGLPRFPDLPARDAARIVRCLARGFDTPVPEVLAPLAARTAEVEARTAELAARDWPRLPSSPGGFGLWLDLTGEPLSNAFVLCESLFRASGRRADYFVVAEHPGVVHYVSGPSARHARDRLERGRAPTIRVSTMHKRPRRDGDGRSGALDLAMLTSVRPLPVGIAGWIDAHPYLVKGSWDPAVPAGPVGYGVAAEAIGRALADRLTATGWGDGGRGIA